MKQHDLILQSIKSLLERILHLNLQFFILSDPHNITM